jgi:hypothetical protein
MSKRILIAVALPLLTLLISHSWLAAQQSARSKEVNPSPANTARTAKVIAATSEILEEVSKLRELKILMPVKSGVKSRSEIEQAVIRNFEESYQPGELDAANKGLIAYGVVPKDFNYRNLLIKLLTEQVAGFYRPKSKELFLADWNEISLQKPIMVHELTHALQDQHFNLKRFENWPRGDGDREAAIHALIEGDATGIMYDYELKPRGSDITRIPAISNFSNMSVIQAEKDNQQVFLSAPAVVRESLIFPYIYGATFVQEMVKQRGWEGVSRAFTDLPQSTEQIIHFEKYSAREAPVKVEMADIASLLGTDWKRIDADVNGEYGYLLILSEFIGKKDAQKAAEGWGGDQSSLYENAAKGQLLLAHLSVWDTRIDSEEFFKAYAARTIKRHPRMTERKLSSANERVFRTAEGETYIELREKSVLVIEGLPSEHSDRLPKLINALQYRER